MAQSINLLVNGGKAVAGATLGSALGPMGVPVGKVVAEINQKTKQFDGIQVPVKVIVDTTTRSFTLEVGTPPASALIKKEAGIEKGNADGSIVGNLTLDQVRNIAKQKEAQCLGSTEEQVMREIMGTCVSMGVTIEGKSAKEFLREQKK